MRVAVYNQMFALNGTGFWKNVVGHYYVHFRNNEDKISELIDLNKTIKIAKKSKADIIGICEILEGQEKELERKLRKIGYKYIYFGEGHKTRFRHLRIKAAIASKIRCNREYIRKEQIENKMGGGGGFVDCYFPKLKLNVMCVHLGLRNKLRKKQLNFLKNHLKMREKFILVGGFNSSYDKIKKYFPDLQLASNEIKTCSLTPFVHFFSWKGCDHIFLRKMKKIRTGFLEGYSDHRLIYADVG